LAAFDVGESPRLTLKRGPWQSGRVTCNIEGLGVLMA
jgi:hypothetical protein